jgi:MFS family permease
MSSALGYEIILSKQIVNNAYKERGGAMTPEAQKIINQYYLLRAIAAFGYGSILATYVQFLTKNGLSLLQAHLVNFIFLVVLLLFEVPTGAFADRYGRKLAFVISCFLTSLSKLVYAFSTSFGGFIIAEMISGIGVALASGAIQAWLIDRLSPHLPAEEQEWKEKVRQVFANENMIKNALLVISALVGSRLAEYNGSYPWIMTAVCMFASGKVSPNW